MDTNYHTQHSPFGAHASFTIGLHHSPGGFGQSLCGPANQNVYVGFRQSGAARWELLPFFKPPQSMLATFAADRPGGAGDEGGESVGYDVIDPGGIDRTLGWASDTWRAGRLALCIYSPFGAFDDPAGLAEPVAKMALAPVVVASLEFDNTDGDDAVELMFGISDTPAVAGALRPMRPVADNDDACVGFATGRDYGYGTPGGDHVRGIQELEIFNRRFSDENGLHRLGHETALIFTVPAGEKRSFPLALGFYRGGTVTTGLDCAFYYTKYFSRLEEVIRHGLDHFDEYVALADKRDAELRAGGLSGEQQFLLAQATHSYLGSTELLMRDGEPLWVVNEGEYRMMNTFDLTVDHLFFETGHWPWAVRNALDLFVERYSYRDGIHTPDGRRAEGGVSFTHDMGVADQFSPPGHSSYECTDLSGCFSHMTCEQLVNWVCCAVYYAERAEDYDWLASHRQTVLDCMESLLRRDDPDPDARDGLMKWDSDRCGVEGAEITTYDSLDVSLGQARNNLYLAVKTLAAWVLLERALERLGEADGSARAGRAADRLAATLVERFDEASGTFPAVFEADNESRILQAVEGLVYPLQLGMENVVAPDGRFGELIGCLGRHMRTVLTPGVCLDADSGAWKMSSTSDNTWFSKTAIAQHVTRRLFPDALTDAAVAADAVHAQWQSTPGCGRFAMCDQINSATGEAMGSRYYPRGVSAWLWLTE